MRRAPRRFAAAILFAGAFGAGFLLTSRIGPHALREATEAALSREIGGKVRISRVRLAFGAGPALEADGVRAWPDGAGHALEIARLQVAFDPRGLWNREIHPQRVLLQGVALHARREADGSWSPPGLDAWVERLDAALPGAPATRGPGALESFLRGVRAGATSLRAFALGGVDVDVEDGRLTVEDAKVVPAGTPPVLLRFEDVALLLRLRGRPDLALAAHARLAADGAPGARDASLELEGWRTSAESRLTLALTDLDLARLLPYAAPLLPPGGVGGSGTGTLELAAAPEGDPTVELDLVLSRLAAGGAAASPAPGRRASATAPGAFRVTRLGVEGRLGVGKEELRLSNARIDADAFSLDADATLGRPLRETSPLGLSLRLAGLSAEQARLAATWLPGDAGEAARGVLAHLRSGALEGVHVSGSGPLADWVALAGGDVARAPSDMELGAELRSVTLDASIGARLEGVSGEMKWRGDTISTRELVGNVDGVALPTLDLTVAGFANLLKADALQRTTPAALPALPGLAPLQDLLTPDGPDDPGPEWTRIDVDADYALIPALLRPLERAKAWIAPTPGGGMHVTVERALWGGAPIQGDVDWKGGERPRVTAHVTAGPPDPAAGRVALRDRAWARGRFSVERCVLISLPFSSGTGSFTAAGQTVRLGDLQGALDPKGDLTGELRFDLSKPDTVPVVAKLQAKGADLRALERLTHIRPEDATGIVDVSADLSGALRDDTPSVKILKGRIPVHARDGTIEMRLPLLLAIAKASDTFNPFPSREGLRYRSLEGDLWLENGFLSSESIALDSPDVRLVLSGSLDTSDGHEVKAVVGVFFLKPLDRVIGAVPIVSQILLGPNRSLFGAYFALTGPFTDPNASLIPYKSVTSAGPGSFVIEGVPEYVRGGLRAIQSVMPRWAGGRDRAAPASEGAPAADAPEASPSIDAAPSVEAVRPIDPAAPLGAAPDATAAEPAEPGDGAAESPGTAPPAAAAPEAEAAEPIAKPGAPPDAGEAP